MEFMEGDRLVGIHGTVHTRDHAGRWWSDRKVVSISDDTAEWCINTEVRSPEPTRSAGPGKISKTEKATDYQPWQYRWRLVRGTVDQETNDD